MEENNQKYHYIVGVGMKSIKSGTPGKFERDILLEYTEEEFKKFLKAVEAAKNPLWKQSLDNACNIFEVENYALIFKGIQLRSVAQQLMLIHFTSDIKLDEKTITTFVEYSNFETLEKYKLKMWEKGRKV